MKEIAKPWFVKNTDFAGRVSKEDMAVFRRVCPDRRYPKGSAVFHSGDPATDLHVIVQGQIKLVTPTPSGSERILAVCGPSDFIGEAFLEEASRYRVDAVALTQVITCPVSREQFVQMATQAPTFALTFAEILAGHLFHCREQLSTSYAPVKVRLVKALLELSRRFGQPGDDAWVSLQTELKHEELASMITATRVSVSMAMAELRDEGLLEGTRGSYKLNAPALTEMAEVGI